MLWHAQYSLMYQLYLLQCVIGHGHDRACVIVQDFHTDLRQCIGGGMAIQNFIWKDGVIRTFTYSEIVIDMDVMTQFTFTFVIDVIFHMCNITVTI